MKLMFKYLTLALVAVAATGCGTQPDPETASRDLARRILVVDTHIDVPDRLHREMEDISSRTAKGDFDYPRAKEGGLDAAFMSIYVPASYQKSGGAKVYADGLIDLVESFERRWPEKFRVARSPEEVRAIAAGEAIALPMGMENGAPIEDDLANLGHFFERGIRYITLTHSENNQICDSSYADEPTWNGLSPFGRQVVEEMNRLGIMIDVSHLSDEAFHQVIEASRAPVIASHSSCRRFTPGWERNMDDEMIRLLGENGGVIQINFGSAFLTGPANEQSLAYWAERKAYRLANDLDPNDPLDGFGERYWQDRERIYATLDDVADHIDHVVEIAGVDHVGFGSDFDGVGDSLPPGLKDVSGYPNLIGVLQERGYSEEQIEKIAGGNLLRVWAEVERTARRLARERPHGPPRAARRRL